MQTQKNGQISVEYLIVVGFVVFLVVSVLGIGFYYSSSIQDQIKFNQLNSFANTIVDASKTVFYAGEPSRLTVSAYLPTGVNQIELSANSIDFTVASSSGVNKISFSTPVLIEGNLSTSPGVKRIRVDAVSDRVILTEG